MTPKRHFEIIWPLLNLKFWFFLAPNWRGRLVLVRSLRTNRTSIQFFEKKKHWFDAISKIFGRAIFEVIEVKELEFFLAPNWRGRLVLVRSLRTNQTSIKFFEKKSIDLMLFQKYLGGPFLRSLRSKSVNLGLKKSSYMKKNQIYNLISR